MVCQRVVCVPENFTAVLLLLLLPAAASFSSSCLLAIRKLTFDGHTAPYWKDGSMSPLTNNDENVVIYSVL